MPWEVLFHGEFEVELDDLAQEAQDEALASLKVLETFGPQLGRPWVDTLKGSRYSKMKELRFDVANGVWRIAFDPRGRAILLCGGEKSGVSEGRFYRGLIATADKRYAAHLALLKAGRKSKP